jgi:hypothetical protein
MKFTWKEFASIEHTAEKFYTVADALSNKESTDRANARALCYVISTIRNAAQLIELNDPEAKAAGWEKVKELFAVN